MSEKKYKIVRFYRDSENLNHIVIRKGLSLEEAQAHCTDPETSSHTCTRPVGKARTAVHGPWFEGYEEQP